MCTHTHLSRVLVPLTTRTQIQEWVGGGKLLDSWDTASAKPTETVLGHVTVRNASQAWSRFPCPSPHSLEQNRPLSVRAHPRLPTFSGPNQQENTLERGAGWAGASVGGGCGAYSVAKCTGEARACTGGWQRTLRAGPLFPAHHAMSWLRERCQQSRT